MIKEYPDLKLHAAGEERKNIHWKEHIVSAQDSLPPPPPPPPRCRVTATCKQRLRLRFSRYRLFQRANGEINSTI